MAFTRKADSGGGDTVKFNTVGDAVTGVYLGSQDYPEGKFGPSVKHIFNTKKGMRVVFAKPGSQIDSLLQGEIGKLVCLTFASTKNTGKGNPLKIYTLDIDSEYTPTADELTGADDDAPEADDDGEEMATSAAKAAPRATPPSAATRAKVNAFVSSRAKQ